MKVIDVLRFNRELLEKIARAGIRLDDIRYIDLFSDYMAMKSQGGENNIYCFHTGIQIFNQ